jgi:Skp family chaperone for outer membrane proteins
MERAAAVVCLGVVAFGALAVATGAGVGSAQPRAATVDAIGILQEILTTPEYADPREEMRAAAVTELETLQGEIRRMGQELQLIPQTDQARGQALYAKFQQAQQQYQELSRQKQEAFMSMSGQQAAEVFEEIYAAANAVAEREGYTEVFSTRAGGTIEDKGNLNAVTQGILSRPLLRFPAADDLTQKVKDEFGYVVPAAEPAGVEPAAGEDAGDGEDAGGGGGG